ncbi:MAG: SDR family oxidoreductase [Oscillospiraceae bacterium]|nr:SDR family oxidoreductase [Oscillospiraceae bacterium]
MKHVLITGGSRGIGAAAVRTFAQAGYRVTFFYEKCHEQARAVAGETGADAICCDVTDTEAVRKAVASIAPVEVLINNAGVAHYGLISQITEAEWERLFSVNVGGIYRCVNAVLPAMLQAQSGCILNVASMWGQVGASCEAAYSASKGAVIALTKALAQELGPSGIRVNCVSPGVILTDMTACVGKEALSDLAEQTPLGRNGTPEDVASALLYLANADYITGQILPVNGGFVV